MTNTATATRRYRVTARWAAGSFEHRGVTVSRWDAGSHAPVSVEVPDGSSDLRITNNATTVLQRSGKSYPNGATVRFDICSID